MTVTDGARVMKKEHDVNDTYEEEEEATTHAIVIVHEKEDEAENETAERTRPL